MQKLLSDRLKYQIINKTHEKLVFETLNYKNTAETISIFSWPMTIKQSSDWCEKSEKAYKNKTDFMFIVFEKSENQAIGCCGIHKENNDKAEIGYWVSEPFQKKGYASEMLSTIISYATTQTELQSLFATVKPGNTGSSRVLEKNGFNLKGRENIKSLDGKLYLKNVYELDLS